jgi:hypothetical protein
LPRDGVGDADERDADDGAEHPSDTAAHNVLQLLRYADGNVNAEGSILASLCHVAAHHSR